jgi:hypothetical protein
MENKKLTEADLAEIEKFARQHFNEGDLVFAMNGNGKIHDNTFTLHFPLKIGDDNVIVDYNSWNFYSSVADAFAWNITKLGRTTDESKRLKFEKQIDSYQII